MTKYDGGPAFPMPGGPKDGYGNPTNRPQSGMSLRDWFAGQALSGPLASIFPVYMPDMKDGGDYSIEQVAAVAYRIADAMIAERGK